MRRKQGGVEGQSRYQKQGSTHGESEAGHPLEDDQKQQEENRVERFEGQEIHPKDRQHGRQQNRKSPRIGNWSRRDAGIFDGEGVVRDELAGRAMQNALRLHKVRGEVVPPEMTAREQAGAEQGREEQDENEREGLGLFHGAEFYP